MSSRPAVLLALAIPLIVVSWVATTDAPTVAGTGRSALVVDDPLDESVFPPDFTSPTFLWHDESPNANAWRIEVRFADGKAPIRVVSEGPPPPAGEIDPGAIGPTNSLFEGTEYQRTARSWTPGPKVWAEIGRRSSGTKAVVTISGYDRSKPDEILASGRVRITTSLDPVGAPLFYRDVPLMAAVGKDGVIAPIDPAALPRIKWRLRDLSRPESKVVLTGVPSCANCHTFPRDGATLAMDVDGPSGDKGSYALAPIEKVTVVDRENVITWNSFPDKPDGHRTIGFLSEVSPDGRHVISTLNEELYVSNFEDYRFLQVFFPTRGILAWYSEETGEMKALPGADDPAYVHCDAGWFPSGDEIVFMRARAFDANPPGRKLARYPNDPREPEIRFDLYRMPFNGGKGGTPVPVEGASGNGMSNTFPRVSPNGKWIVFTKCRNGMLMRPDGRLWIVPAEGGKAREMRCNTPLMNSWHSFSPNGRWMVFSSKSRSPYTQLFLTHIDENGNDSPAIYIPNSTAANRAANIPEFLNRPFDALQAIDVPAVDHHRHLQEGIRLSREGKFEEALASLDASLEKEPGFTRALGHRGRALLELGRVEEARATLRRALEIDPEFAFLHVTLGVSYMREGDRKRAERCFLRALELDTKNHMAHYNLAVLRLEQERPIDALESARTASRLVPSDADTRNLHGWILMRCEQWDAAAKEFRAALAHDAGHERAQENLLAILRKRGPASELISHLEAMVASRPEVFELKLNLSWELATRREENLRDGVRAVELALECRKKLGEQPAVLDVLAAALAEAGRFAEAVKVATRAVELVKAGRGQAGPGLQERLAGYRERRPVRQP